MTTTNMEIIKDMLESLPTYKLDQLERALDQNFHYTGTRILETAELEVYKQGFRLLLFGCRTSFRCVFSDSDGELHFVTAKPHGWELLYTDSGHMSESDFFEF